MNAGSRLDEYTLGFEVPRRWWDFKLTTRTLEFTAAAHLRAHWDVGPILLLHLDSHFRVAGVQCDGAAVEFLQAAAPPVIFNPSYEGNWLVLKLPRGLGAGEGAELTFQYSFRPMNQQEANVLDHNPLWYPAEWFGGPMRARFDVTATSDPDVKVVSAGTVVRNERVNGYQVTAWRTPAPAAGVGFTIHPGIMDSDRRPQTGSVELEDGREAELTLEPIDRYIEGVDDPFLPRAFAKTGPDHSLYDQAANALRFLDRLFGAYPFAALSLAEARETASLLSNLPALALSPGGLTMHADGRDAPAWPMLSQVAVWSYSDATLLRMAGRPDAAVQRYLKMMPAHAEAHQWFGVAMQPETPHDQWLTDGLANAGALLFAEKSFDAETADEQLRQWQWDLLRTDVYGHRPNDDGPLWLGPRLGGSRDPLAHDYLLAEKGGYVFWMLRQMMAQEGRADPDDGFRALLHAFTAAGNGHEVSTREFAALADQYMTESMDLEHNHSMAWFFNDYVYSAWVPRLTFAATVEPAGAGKSAVHMHVDNPEHWHGLLPVYLMKPEGGFERGWLHVTDASVDSTSTVNYTPLRVIANKEQDMLVELDAAQPAAAKAQR